LSTFGKKSITIIVLVRPSKQNLPSRPTKSVSLSAHREKETRRKYSLVVLVLAPPFPQHWETHKHLGLTPIHHTHMLGHHLRRIRVVSLGPQRPMIRPSFKMTALLPMQVKSRPCTPGWLPWCRGRGQWKLRSSSVVNATKTLDLITNFLNFFRSLYAPVSNHVTPALILAELPH
jgi:hypothetical protein